MPREHEKYYRLLDLEPGASKEEVKKAFRELSQIYHPDNYARKSPEVQKRSEEKFKKLSNAYQILKDYLSEEDSSREAEEKTKAEQDRRDREEQNRKKAEKNRRDREAENRRKAEQGRRDKEEQNRKKTEKNRRDREAENRRKAEQDRRDKEEQNRKKTEKSRREEEVKEKKHWEEQAKKKQDEEWRRKNKTVQFPTNCPICKESITINSTLSQSKTKIHFEVFCKFCKGTYLYFFKDGVPIFPSYSNENHTESSKEYSSQKNDNRGESKIWTIGVIFSKLLAFLLISWVVFIIGSIIFFIIQPNDHSDSSSTATVHKGNHLSQSKLSNEIHTLKEEVRLSRLSAEQGVADAQYKMGTFYYMGKGVPQDYKEAVKWYRLAAEQGFTKAQTRLGGMYFDGLGVTQDHVLAYKWLNNAGSNGDKDDVINRTMDQSRLGLIYEKETEKVDMGIWATEENQTSASGENKGLTQPTIVSPQRASTFRENKVDMGVWATDENQAEQKLIDGLEKAAKVINKNTPKMVDEYTRMDAATIGPGSRININYTLPKYSAGEIDADHLVLNMRPKMKNYVCSKKNMKLVLQSGAYFAYLYHDKDGMLITSITIDRNDCGLSKIVLYDDDYQNAHDAYESGDYKEAVRLFRLSAEQGNGLGQSNLGKMYSEGKGVPQDYKEAVRLYRLSAEQGDATGQANLGVMYSEGKGVPQDYKEAVRLFQLSAEQGHAHGQANLGKMYSAGKGVPQDYKEAVRLYRLSAEQGHAQGQTNLSVMYKLGQGVPQDDKEAVRLSRLSAEQGLALGQYNLGVMYYKGQGVPKDYKEAVRLYRLSAEQNFAKAQYNLGVMYHNGEGLPRDYKEAVRLYRLSAEQGDAIGQYNLGVMYYSGQGVPQDYVSAHMWWNICGSSGKINCTENRYVVEKEMSPSQIKKAQEMVRNWKLKK